MPEYKPDSTTNKWILLFIFDKMEIPLTENSIMDICTNKNNWLKYMDCKEYGRKNIWKFNITFRYIKYITFMEFLWNI